MTINLSIPTSFNQRMCQQTLHLSALLKALELPCATQNREQADCRNCITYVRRQNQNLLLRRSKPFVLLVGLVPVAVLLRFQLGTELLENGLEQLLLASLVVGVAGPDGDLDSVPTN